MIQSLANNPASLRLRRGRLAIMTSSLGAKANQGFTLVEVMVASIIFVIFCVFFLNSMIASMHSHQLACDYYKAMTIARNRIQRAKIFDYSTLPLLSESNRTVNGHGHISSTGMYQRTTIVAIYTNGTPNLTKVTVQVYYHGARRSLSSRPVELITLVTDNM